jgi:hypothetical protein
VNTLRMRQDLIHQSCHMVRMNIVRRYLSPSAPVVIPLLTTPQLNGSSSNTHVFVACISAILYLWTRLRCGIPVRSIQSILCRTLQHNRCYSSSQSHIQGASFRTLVKFNACSSNSSSSSKARNGVMQMSRLEELESSRRLSYMWRSNSANLLSTGGTDRCGCG